MKCKSVIVECGYLSNPEDRAIIQASDFPMRAAEGIGQAIESMTQHPPSHKKELREIGERIIKISEELP
jgi:hypothetical protein